MQETRENEWGFYMRHRIPLAAVLSGAGMVTAAFLSTAAAVADPGDELGGNISTDDTSAVADNSDGGPLDGLFGGSDDPLGGDPAVAIADSDSSDVLGGNIGADDLSSVFGDSDGGLTDSLFSGLDDDAGLTDGLMSGVGDLFGGDDFGVGDVISDIAGSLF